MSSMTFDDPVRPTSDAPWPLSSVELRCCDVCGCFVLLMCVQSVQYAIESSGLEGKQKDTLKRWLRGVMSVRCTLLSAGLCYFSTLSGICLHFEKSFATGFRDVCGFGY